MIKFLPASGIEAEKWIRWMDGEVFPNDKPVTFIGSYWFIGWEGKQPACYAAWRPHYPTNTLSPLHITSAQGFQYRAGVLPAYRSRGYQKKLLAIRERAMLAVGIKEAVTYTDPQSAASMRSLIACGYMPFVPTKETNLSGEGRAGLFVHWRKAL